MPAAGLRPQRCQCSVVRRLGRSSALARTALRLASTTLPLAGTSLLRAPDHFAQCIHGEWSQFAGFVCSLGWCFHHFVFAARTGFLTPSQVQSISKSTDVIASPASSGSGSAAQISVRTSVAPPTFMTCCTNALLTISNHGTISAGTP